MNKKQVKETVKYMLRSNLMIRKYVKEIEEMYITPPILLKKRNETKFIKLFQRAYTKSPFYHRLYSGVGIKLEDIKSLEDITKLPIVTKEMIRDHIDEMLLIPKWKTVRNHTSGSTGKPLEVYEDWPSIWREQAYFYCYRKRCGYVYGKDVMASLRGHLDRKTKSLYVSISKTLYLSSYDLSEVRAKEYYELLKKHKPKAIEGYPSSLFALAKMLDKQGYTDINIPVAFTSSETLEWNMRNYIERILHTQIYDHYGNTERTIRLEESLQHNGYYEDPGYSINEYQEDCVITTSLINTSFPLIRYKVDDILVRKEVNNVQEVGHPTIERIHGRTTDCIIGKDGTHFSGAALSYFAKAIPNISTVQLIQEEVGKMFVHLVPDTNFSTNDEAKITGVVREILGADNIDYSVRKISVEELQYAKNGKLSLIVSKIKK